MAYSGPKSGLPGTARRQGRGGTAYDAGGNHLGDVVAVDWDVEAEAVDVLIPGSWRNEQIAGAESRRMTIRFQDVDDQWKLKVWRFFEARRLGDFLAQPPFFNLTTKLVGGADETRWQLIDCQVFAYSGGYSNEDDVINRELTGSFRSDKPLHAFEYGPGGLVVTEA